MWFGLPAEIAVRCEHCGENDGRTPVELRSGYLACFRCTRVSGVPPVPAAAVEPGRSAPTAVLEIARRSLAALLPSPRGRVTGRRRPGR
jgi:hypothetical protein